MKTLNRQLHKTINRGIKIMQFGEGNFLRAFVDYIIQNMNETNVISSNVVVVQPLITGRIDALNEQNGLYTLYLEGVENKKIIKQHRIIDVLSDFINPYTQYDKFLEYAKSKDLEVIISNTTEAGIVLDAKDIDFSKCPDSFPGKLLAFLLARYNYFNGDKICGLSIIPCELIDYNGTELKKVLLQLANIMQLDERFIDWLLNANHFTNTLVDRIVPGYPKEQIAEIQKETGYIDNSVVKGELFHLWVLEKEEFIQKHFPADKCGLNVIYANDIKPYKERKVKILNGTHTALVPIAYLSGFDTVRESICDPIINEFLLYMINSEIRPTINLPIAETEAFANSVLERFQNPFIRHELMSISLNSTTKFKTRLLPTLIDYINITKDLPQNLLFAFAGLIMFFKGKRGQENIALADNADYLERWEIVWEKNGSYIDIVKEVTSWEDIWGVNISTLHEKLVMAVANYLEKIDKYGMKKALIDFLTA